MLFRLKTGTPISVIFTALNIELIHFLEKSVQAKRFSRGLFSPDFGEAIWENSKTKEKFQQLWMNLKVLPENQRATVALAVKDHQDLSIFFGTLDIRPPMIGASLGDYVDAVTRHLFNRTSHLAGIERLSTETLNTHFNVFKNINGKVCCACGIQPLAEYRANIADDDQWRSAFDHVLALTHFPYYGIHAKNLIPCCDHCNSKAKGQKNMLCSDDGTPRRAFYPHSESCNEYVALELEFGQITITPRLKLVACEPSIQEKLNTWNAVYVIKDRIEGWLKDWIPMIDAECKADGLDELREKLREQGRNSERLPPIGRIKFLERNLLQVGFATERFQPSNNIGCNSCQTK